MRVIRVFKNEAIPRNTAQTVLIDIEHDLRKSLIVSCQFHHIGGTMTITMSWSIDGVNFVAVAADADGDVSVIGTDTPAWDNFTIPAVASLLEVTATETNVGACTGIDLFLGVR